MSRRPFIVGNWKMNKGPQDAGSLASQLKAQLAGTSAVDVGVSPPYISIPSVCRMLQHTGIIVAGQDLHPQTSGAFTSAISGEMIRQAGCSYVIVGHSERRALFGDDDKTVNAKVHAAFRAGLLPILCVGETRTQRESGEADE
ncbi:MAG: triose-phosphate isomerase, partial [Myxococcota bacterium]|nr:triose-phosphate isomerase [Myxococcota bacterium]